MIGANLTSRVEGISNMVREVSLGLAGRGHEIHYLTSAPEGEMAGVPEDIILHQVDVGDGKGYGERGRSFLLGMRSLLRRVSRDEGIDAIHCHSAYPVFGNVVGGSSLGLSCKKVVSIYSSGKDERGLEEYPAITRLALRISKRPITVRLDQYLFDKIIAMSGGVKRSLDELSIAADKRAFIPVCVDAERFNPSVDARGVREGLGIGPDETAILFAGDLTPWKGVEVLLRAFHLARKRDSRIKMLVMAKGTYEFEDKRRGAIMELLRELGLAEVVVMIGRRDDMPQIYAASDMVVLPYLANFALMDVPRSLLEAMASGRPVIASRIGGIPEVVRDRENGLLTLPGSVGEILDAIMLLIGDPEATVRLGREARETVESRHSVRTSVAQLDTLYGTLVKERV